MKKIDREKIQSLCLPMNSTIRETMQVISQGAIGAAMVVDKDSSFIRVVSDGDIRRGLLKGHTLESTLDVLGLTQSTTASVGISTENISKMFSEEIRIIPILNEEKVIVDIALYDQRFHLPVAEPLLGEKELEYVTDCIVTNWISSTGKYVARFEDMFAEFCNTSHAIATSNGTTGLHLALLALGVGPGDEVIVPTFTFISTANAVTYTGANPVFVDCDLLTWNIDPLKIEQAITKKTKAIIPVHLYGHPADMDKINDIAKKYNLFVIEDAAEAHGAEYKNKKVGGLSDIGVFSFFGNKIVTTGEGGMITTNNGDFADKMRLLRDHGMSPDQRYWHKVLGYNYRMTNVQAAIGVAQMERVDAIIDAKLKMARRYQVQFEGVEGLVCPPCADWAKNVYWLYSILIKEEDGITRNQIVSELKSFGIDTRPLFPPIHTQPIYNTHQSLPISEKLAKTGLSLPSSAALSEQEIDRVCMAVKSIMEKKKSRV